MHRANIVAYIVKCIMHFVAIQALTSTVQRRIFIISAEIEMKFVFYKRSQFQVFLSMIDIDKVISYALKTVFLHFVSKIVSFKYVYRYFFPFVAGQLSL